MVILGLTGSIGMGKSATAEKFRMLRIPVFDSDATIHTLIGDPAGRAFQAVITEFPDVLHEGVIDRQKLGAVVFNNTPALKKLEAILHPLVRTKQEDFLKESQRQAAATVVLDIPLLFETGAETRCDYVVVCSCPEDLQKKRVLARPGMTVEKFKAILERQTPDAIKRERADFIVETGQGHPHAVSQIDDILKTIHKDDLKQETDHA